MHISGIESGKIVPRYDTLLDLVRVLDYDLLTVPRSLVPAPGLLSAIMQTQTNNATKGSDPLYAVEGTTKQRGRPTMNFDPKKLNTLAVELHGRRIGVINRLAGDRQLFAFEQDYIDDTGRPTLSLSFKGETGGLVTATRPTGPAFRPFSRTSCPKAICGTIWQRARGEISTRVLSSRCAWR